MRSEVPIPGSQDPACRAVASELAPAIIEVRAGRRLDIVADPLKRVPGSAIGEFFVDRTCIGCETCAQLAPEIFDEAGEFFRVCRQPISRGEIRCAT